MAEQSSNRGRFQAQGPNRGPKVEESEAWAQALPPTSLDGHRMLNSLSAKLSPTELAFRASAFAAARQFVDRAAAKGGVDARVSKTFPTAPSDGRRVDVEVIAGRAFVRPAVAIEGEV